MKRALVGAVWGMILYLIIYSIAGAILGGAAAESWRPTIALVAAALAAGVAGKGGYRAQGIQKIRARLTLSINQSDVISIREEKGDKESVRMPALSTTRPWLCMSTNQ